MSRKDTFSRWLPVKLTDEETLEKAKKLSRLERERASVEVEKKSVMSRFQQELKEFAGQIAELSRAIEKGEEQREVECAEDTSFEKKKIYTRRLDTQEIIHERDLPVEETQENMFEEGTPEKF